MLRLGGSVPIEMFGFSDASHFNSGKSKYKYGGVLYLVLDRLLRLFLSFFLSFFLSVFLSL
jgi:hypothetical protein